MTEPKPQLELIAGADVGGAVTDKPLPNDTAEAARTAAIGVALAMKATAGGGKIDPDVAIDMLRNAGLVDDEADPASFDYSWENGNVIVSQQLATAVYINNEGAAVIRQENPDLDDERGEQVIIVQHKNLPEVITALTKIAKAPCNRTAPKAR